MKAGVSILERAKDLAPQGNVERFSPPVLLESQVQAQILSYLRFRGIWVYVSKVTGIPDKRARGGFRKAPKKGIPDLTGYFGRRWGQHAGRAVYVEVKRPGAKIDNPKQISFIQEAKDAGCMAMFASSIEEVEEELKKWKP